MNQITLITFQTSMSHFRASFIILSAIIISACASSGAPVKDASTTVPVDASQYPKGQEGLQGQPLRPSESIGGEALSAKRSTPPVVAKLLRQSEQAGAEQDWPRAETYLQRALRISPKNALLWSRMAEAKLQQGKNAQAVQFASKSNAISADANLRQRNEAIMAAARQ